MAERPPAGVELVRCPRDYGPATKLLGCLPRLPAEACLIVVDDDMLYKPFLVERLYRAQLDRRGASFSFFVERVGRLRFGQGADGFSFWTPNLRGIDEFAAVALRSRHLFVADDLWVSVFLRNRRVPILSLQPTLATGELVWARSHAEHQLSDLQGDLARPGTFRHGLRFLAAEGLMRPSVRASHWLGLVERAPSAARRALRARSRPGLDAPVQAAGRR